MSSVRIWLPRPFLGGYDAEGSRQVQQGQASEDDQARSRGIKESQAEEDSSEQQLRALSSSGRATALQAVGDRFESDRVHQIHSRVEKRYLARLITWRQVVRLHPLQPMPT